MMLKLDSLLDRWMNEWQQVWGASGRPSPSRRHTQPVGDQAQSPGQGLSERTGREEMDRGMAMQEKNQQPEEPKQEAGKAQGETGKR